MLKLDEKDRRILALLQQDAKATTQQMAKKLLMPVTTAHNRVKKLERMGVITGYGARVDWGKLGKAVSAFVLITVDNQRMRERGLNHEDIVERLAHFAFIEDLSLVTGITDIVAKVRVADIEQLSHSVLKEIHKVDGVEKTQTMVVLPATGRRAGTPIS